MVTQSRESAVTQRVRIAIRGAVQGVGFRPFVYRLATSLNLGGWVTNSSHGVLLEAEGERDRLEEFIVRLASERPPRSFIQSFEPVFLDAAGLHGFEIRPSVGGEAPSAIVLPDIAVCGDCLRELFDPADRRYRYPFINCTNCGPRFSIIQSLPYDRPATTMRRFEMCPQCRREYEDPVDRRFHAQPNACPTCGPQLELWECGGRTIERNGGALSGAAAAIKDGRIVAVKGLGGFHLVVDARSEAAVAALRRRKGREEKPFALMYPALDRVRVDCAVSPLEERLLTSAESPIVLLPRNGATTIAANVAPGVPELGVMLPYTPLHHLLLGELAFPVVATSGNLSDEPICTDEKEALVRLSGIADLFLVHDRPIARHVDDSIVRVVLGREMVVRRARGYAPLPVGLPDSPKPILAVGAHLKNTVAIAVRGQAFVSQHVGDLETEQAYRAFKQVIADFGSLYSFSPAIVACDLHPDYLSSGFARDTGLPSIGVQHHEAHVLSCMAENGLEPPVLGVAWDGTGFGTDGTAWGGEFILVSENGCERRAAMRAFPLPGANVAAREPRRSALGLLFEAFGAEALDWSHLAPVAAFGAAERRTLATLLVHGTNCPRTSSVGRLFDAVASLTGLHQRVGFEGQAAMALQFAADASIEDEAYDVRLVASDGAHASDQPAATMVIADWMPLLRQLLEDIGQRVPVGRISARFHNALANVIGQVAVREGHAQVVLTGGCFQNRLLIERAVGRLRSLGLRVYWHQRIPTNDGGIALGQLVAAVRRRGGDF